MPLTVITAYLDRQVDPATDHVLGSERAQISLVEYGSYACPYCRAANERIIEVREQLSDRLCYIFRHKPLTNNDLALRAARLVERGDRAKFWDAHELLMTRSGELTEDDLRAAADLLGIPRKREQRIRGEGGRACAARRRQRQGERRVRDADLLHQQPPL